jgi:formate dehydrogenase major subunit
MTNHWTDIDNASLVFVFGANPAENHPACFAHINAARYGSKNAKLVVIDPRRTRTALQCDPDRGDFYVRIRPGTDIAMINGLLNWIFNNVSAYDAVAAANMLGWHNGTAANSLSLARTFQDDAGSAAATAFNTANLATAKYNGVAAPQLVAGYPKYCDTRFKVNTAGDDYQRATLTVGSNSDYLTDPVNRFSNFPVIAADVNDPECVYQQLKSHVAPYDLATVADICGCTQAEIVSVAQVLVDNSRFKSSDFGAATATPQAATYKATTILYAMGQTQHTNGSQNIKGLATLQTLLGNMGRAGGGINALRGIHNVQGSTDMANLYDGVPGYSGNPGTGETYAHYSNTLFGNRVDGTGAKDITVPANLGLQQRGFHNMTQEWFGNGAVAGSDMTKLWDLWPKGNGFQHIQAIRNMALADGDPARIKAAVVWGQNPAVTEPNQSKVREAFHNLDLLVVVDMFETETASVDRRADGITYLLPACSHVEEAGSVTNSGRWLQWRERAVAPKGNSKADLELLLRLAYALDGVGAFSHISTVWGTLATPITGSVYSVLYGKHGWTPGSGAFEALTVNTEMWAEGASAPANKDVFGSEVVAEKIHIEICRPLNDTATSGGTLWIYSGAGNAAGYYATLGDFQPPINGVAWQTKARAKSRNNTLTGATTNGANNYPRWGWAWLLNRRVFYNNGEVAGDVADVFVSPGAVCCLFTVNNSSTLLADWSLFYRKYKTFADKPDVVVSALASSPHFTSPGRSLAGRFAGHTEPIESPRPALQALWGKNTANGTPLILSGTAVGDVATYPLVLTTIRCVEHFQGGPITRNNPANYEAEPEPWIELNPVDARKYGIVNGDLVNIVTARSNSTSDQNGRTVNESTGVLGDSFAVGFRARVDNSIAAYQRVAPGVVAIPWHWGDRGLSQGSRANDLCIDAFDANTQIPEYKACLCRIEKA